MDRGQAQGMAPERCASLMVRAIAAQDKAATTWHDSQPVGVGTSPSLKSNLGLPAIAYSSGDLVYNRALNREGTLWNGPLVVATDPSPTNDRGFTPDMVTSDTWPLITDVTLTPSLVGNVWFTSTSDIQGDTWAASKIVSGPGLFGLTPSIEIVNLMPAIAYRHMIDASTSTLYYCRSMDGWGDAWAAAAIVLHDDFMLSVGQSLVAVDNKTRKNTPFGFC